MYAPPRVPVPPKRRFEARFGQLARTVDALQRAQPFQPDEAGRFRIGDVYLIQEPLDDGTIRLSAQNALTEGVPVMIGVLT